MLNYLHHYIYQLIKQSDYRTLKNQDMRNKAMTGSDAETYIKKRSIDVVVGTLDPCH